MLQQRHAETVNNWTCATLTCVNLCCFLAKLEKCDARSSISATTWQAGAPASGGSVSSSGTSGADVPKGCGTVCLRKCDRAVRARAPPVFK